MGAAYLVSQSLFGKSGVSGARRSPPCDHLVARAVRLPQQEIAVARRQRAEEGTGGEIPANATFETGDSWTFQGTRFRLYGVQSCLRQTSFTNEHNLKRDCGEASLAMLIALIRDLKPLCYSAATSPARKRNSSFALAPCPRDATRARESISECLSSLLGMASRR